MSITTTTIDLAPLLVQVVIPLAGAALSGLVPYAVYKFAALLHVKISDATRAHLQDAATHAVATAVNEASMVVANSKLSAVDLHSAILAAAVTNINQNAPGAIKTLGLTPDAVENMVSARLAPEMVTAVASAAPTSTVAPPKAA